MNYMAAWRNGIASDYDCFVAYQEIAGSSPAVVIFAPLLHVSTLVGYAFRAVSCGILHLASNFNRFIAGTNCSCCCFTGHL